MKIVTAPNAFKGSLPATEAAIAMEAGLRRILPEAEVTQVPVPGGGDGLVEVANMPGAVLPDKMYFLFYRFKQTY